MSPLPGSGAESESVTTPQPTYAIRHFLKAEAPDDFARALYVRLKVFVEEQNVPIDREQDEYEDECRHWLLCNATDDKALATGRMRAYQEGCQMQPVAKIERIAVSATHRGLKLGDAVMQAILAFAHAEGYPQAILDAQVPVIRFYEKFGFEAEGDEFEDAGIPHYRMRLVF